MYSLRQIFAMGLLALSLDTPARADDTLVDGKPCNAFCQSWLGVKAAPALPTVPVQTRPEPLRQSGFAVEAAEPRKLPALASRPASEDETLQPQGPESKTMFFSGAAGVPFRSGMDRRSRASGIFSLRRPSSNAATGWIILTEPSSAQNDVVASQDPGRDGGIDADPFGPTNRSFASRRRSNQVGGRDRARQASSKVEMAMEPGLKGLPSVSKLVAVHGSIIVESAQEIALNAALRSRMVKSTSRSPEAKNSTAPGKIESDLPVSTVSAIGAN